MSKKKKYNQEETIREEKNTAEPVPEEEKLEETEQEEEILSDEETVQEEQPSEEEPEKSTEEKEKPAKKERKLKWAKQDELEEKVREATDRYARLFAEFDNFRKRTDKEKAQRYDFGVRDIVEKILPVIDNFERGLAAVPEDKADDSFVTGMQMTYKQLMKTLEDAGVKPIDVVGQEFNPDFHNAVMHVDDPEVGDNIIVEEFQKGYIYKDHVVRYSMVKVAN
ncbi:MAG: nucleotide exchange factor GrpE [Parasporobacterium sp.]|nr:nucleotide exchange factor GrpE [Parasporobacterium sp.]